MPKVSGFPPITGQNTRVLILGTMPGGRSLELEQYYGNSQNRFWRVMADVLGLSFPDEYNRRIEALSNAGVGLWDVLKTCERPNSSLDSKIVRGSEIPNDFVQFLDANRGVKALALNGQKAADLYQRLVPAGAARQVEVLPLPSTSPANARVRFDELVKAWRVVKEYLD